MPSRPPRILIFSASIGEGHDGPARRLTADLNELDPAALVETDDFLALVPLLGAIAMRGSSFHSAIGSWAFDATFVLLSDVGPIRRAMNRFVVAVARRRMLRRIEAYRPDVIVSTYPGATIVLGELRSRGVLGTPTVAAITDLAALTVWAHPGIDLHLITHPESVEEVRALAPPTEIRSVSGFTSPGFEREPDPARAREALGLPGRGPVVVVSGGGWAVGDLEGATAAALSLPGVTVVCLCGRNEQVRARLTALFEDHQAVVVRGFTDRIAEYFAAADVVVHSTAGLTVLEALISGCRVISYGWGHGHIRVNNEAFARFGLAEVARDRSELRVALHRALAAPRRPERALSRLPSAAAAVYELAG